MKKTRKLMAIMMVMAIMLSVMVMSAAAVVPEEEVAPCAVYHFCDTCGAQVQQISILASTRSLTVNSCASASGSHTHIIRTYDVYDDCPTCGMRYIKTTTKTTCNG